MTTVFIVCAAIGCTVLVFQFALTMIGFGGEALDIDVSGDMDGDLDLDFDGDVDFDADMDQSHIGSTWLFGVISFRTVIAALAFFGLAGLAAQQSGATPIYTIIIAVLAGLGAMYGVYWLYRGLTSLRSDGTVRVRHALGEEATAYTTIPAENSASGKIQINIQNQTMEYLALTPGHEIRPGTKVVVTNIITSDTVEVEPINE